MLNAFILLSAQCWRGQVTLMVTAHQVRPIIFSPQPAKAKPQKWLDVWLVNLPWPFGSSFTTSRKQEHISNLRKMLIGCSL